MAHPPVYSKSSTMSPAPATTKADRVFESLWETERSKITSKKTSLHLSKIPWGSMILPRTPSRQINIHDITQTPPQVPLKHKRGISQLRRLSQDEVRTQVAQDIHRVRSGTFKQPLPTVDPKLIPLRIAKEVSKF